MGYNCSLVPLITSNVKRLMRNRDFHKKQAIKHASSAQWNMYTTERNMVVVPMRSAKKYTFVIKSKDVHKVGMLKRARI